MTELTPEPTDRAALALENQMSRRERARRGALLRAEAPDLALLASESSLPTNLVEKAHQARMTAIRADPTLSTITETEAIVQAVLEEQERTKPKVDIAQEEWAIRQRVLRKLAVELNFPAPKNAAAAEYQGRIGARLKKFMEDNQ